MKTKLAVCLGMAMVLLGIVGCGTDSEAGSTDGALRLPFVHQGALAPSSRVPVPGGTMRMGLEEGRILSTGSNSADQSLAWLSTSLRIDADAPVGGGRVLCSTRARGKGTRIAESAGRLAALYPRSSEVGIYAQEVPGTLLVRFHSKVDRNLAILRTGHAPSRFTSVRGVKVGWPRTGPRRAVLSYELPAGRPRRAIELPFFMVWLAREPTTFRVSCTLSAPAGRATVATEGSLPAPPGRNT